MICNIKDILYAISIHSTQTTSTSIDGFELLYRIEREREREREREFNETPNYIVSFEITQTVI